MWCDACKQEIFDYLKLHFYDNGNTVNNFSVNMNYPKMELTEMSKTVHELVILLLILLWFIAYSFCIQGLHPRGMLYVNDLDS